MLTPRQSDVLRAVESLTAQQGYPPTVRELGRHLGITSEGARKQLGVLARKGSLIREEATARAIRVVVK